MAGQAIKKLNKLYKLKGEKSQDTACEIVCVSPINIPEYKSEVKTLGNIKNSKTSSIFCFSFQRLDVTISSDIACSSV